MSCEICIVSIAGAFRKGKSFMLNIFGEFLEKSEKGANNESWCNKDMKLDKFHWRGGTQPNTIGIYLWSKPFIRKDKNGEEVAVFLMDTQGTFDSRSTVKQCATIFALSVMISSINIFNVSMNIQEDDLQNLSLFTEYAKLARTNCGQKPFQRLLILVRDWQNSEEYEYGFKGGQEFLKAKLKITSEQARELKELRANLNNSFQQMDCFLMPHPGPKIANNNKNKGIQDAEEDFLKYASELVQKIFDKTSIQAKSIAGKELTCEQLAQYFEAFTKIFNSDTIPEPKSILQATAEIAKMQALNECKSDYNRLMKAAFNAHEPDIAKLAQLHDSTKTAILAKYDNASKFGGNSSKDKLRKELEEHIMQSYTHMKQLVSEIEAGKFQKRERLLLEEETKARIEHQKMQSEMEKRRMELLNKEQEVRNEMLRNEMKARHDPSSIKEVFETIQEVAKTIVPVVTAIINSSR